MLYAFQSTKIFQRGYKLNIVDNCACEALVQVQDEQNISINNHFVQFKSSIKWFDPAISVQQYLHTF